MKAQPPATPKTKGSTPNRKYDLSAGLPDFERSQTNLPALPEEQQRRVSRAVSIARRNLALRLRHAWGRASVSAGPNWRADFLPAFIEYGTVALEAYASAYSEILDDSDARSGLLNRCGALIAREIEVRGLEGLLRAGVLPRVAEAIAPTVYDDLEAPSNLTELGKLELPRTGGEWESLTFQSWLGLRAENPQGLCAPQLGEDVGLVLSREWEARVVRGELLAKLGTRIDELLIEREEFPGQSEEGGKTKAKPKSDATEERKRPETDDRRSSRKLSPDARKRLGQALVRSATKAGLSQEKTAEELKTAVSTVKLWEKGKTQPRPDNLARILDFIRETLGDAAVDELRLGR